MSAWIMKELGPDVPLHLTAFHPDHKMDDTPATPPATLTRSRQIALDAGLNYVYTGNVHDADGGTTRCPQCRKALIVRDWYRIDRHEITPESKCPHCAATIAGEFELFEGQFGRQRIPIAINRRPAQ
jgi:pyruvate formate lyase activating enzyme